MAYSVSVVDKQLTNGQLVVVVEYSDGEHVVRETMTSRSNQDGDWLQKETVRRAKELDGLMALKEAVVVGPVETTDVTPLSDASTTKQTYETKLRDCDRYLSALAKGVLTMEHAEFVTLRQWLRDNFRDEYLDLF